MRKPGPAKDSVESALVITFTVAATLLGLSCAISPQPIPPSVDASRIAITYSREDPGDPEPNIINVIGADGAVTPVNSSLTISNLFNIDSWVVVDVDAEGRFQAALSGMVGDYLRLQAEFESRYSEGVEVFAPDEGGTVEEVEHPLEECLHLIPSDVLDFGNVVVGNAHALEITLENQCDTPIFFETFNLERSLAATNNCLFEREICIHEPSSLTESCHMTRQECNLSCARSFSSCRDEGNPEEECEELYLECLTPCDMEYFTCVNMACEGEYHYCLEETPYAQSSFGIAVAGNSLDIDIFGTNSIIGTFSPAEPGRVEELLHMRFGNGTGEYSMYILLTGHGVEY